MDYVLDHLRTKLKREPTAEEYVALNGVPVDDIEGEMLATCPRKCQKQIERMANQARPENDIRNVP